MKREYETSITIRLPISMKEALDKRRLKDKVTLQDLVKAAIQSHLGKKE